MDSGKVVVIALWLWAGFVCLVASLVNGMAGDQTAAAILFVVSVFMTVGACLIPVVFKD